MSVVALTLFEIRSWGLTMFDKPETKLTREEIYRQVLDAAYAVARHQSPAVAAHAEDIAQDVVLKFANRGMTLEVINPAAWGATYARYACINYANRGLAHRRNEQVDDAEYWAERIDINPGIYPYKSVAGADAIEFALSCLNEREREMLYLIEAGYSHAEVAEMLRYAGARSVTTTMNRIRNKITEHVGSRAEVEELLSPSLAPIYEHCLAMAPLLDHPAEGEPREFAVEIGESPDRN
jgi:RNA polymerase sigma factor (sigma-70 family)